jgi:hypothetical protein
VFFKADGAERIVAGLEELGVAVRRDGDYLCVFAATGRKTTSHRVAGDRTERDGIKNAAPFLRTAILFYRRILKDYAAHQVGNLRKKASPVKLKSRHSRMKRLSPYVI